MSLDAASQSFMAQFPQAELAEERHDLDLGPEGRCIQRLIFHRGQLVWFSMMLEVSVDAVWHQVARADTCHDEAHLHRFVRGQEEEISRHVLRPIGTVDDVGEGFEHACDLLLDEWEENVRRWNRGK